MELRRWILDDHDGLGARFTQSIAAHVPVERWREQVDGGGASIAALVFHVAWHEDLAIATAVQGRAPQLETWRNDLGLDGREPADGLGEAEDPTVSALLDLDALVSYWGVVRSQTSSWLSQVDLSTLDDLPPVTQRLSDLAGVTPSSAGWLHRLWSDKPVAFFVRWEAIGHPQGHLGEMISMRGRLGLSPF